MKQQAKVEQMMEDINIIKEIFRKTKQSLQKSATFFILFGVIQVIAIVQSILLPMLVIRGKNGGGGNSLRAISRMSMASSLMNIILLLIEIGILIYFVKKSSQSGEGLSFQLISIWGFILLSSDLILYVLKISLYDGVGEALRYTANSDFYLILITVIEIIRNVSVGIGIFVTGVLTDKLGCKVLSVVYLILVLVLFYAGQVSGTAILSGDPISIYLTTRLMGLLTGIVLLYLGISFRWKEKRIVNL